MTRDLLMAWMYTRPRVRRVWLMMQLLWAGSLTAVLAAPRASADTIAGSLSFTGLHDSYGLPIGSLFVSVLPMGEVVGANGPQFGVSPTTWMPALLSALGTAATYTQLAGCLGLECAGFLCICAIGIWIIKFALGAIWLGWLAALAQPIVANIQAIVARMHLIVGGMTVSVLVGGIVCQTIGYATGMGIIIGGLAIAVLTWLLLRDPVGELVSDNGILGMGRSLGFTVSQGLGHNGPVAAGGTSAQLETLTSWLCDVLARDVIELISFGQVIDDIPGCAERFNSAILSGVTSAPAQAMKTCAPSAYAHSQQLSLVTVGFFGLVIGLILVVLLALDYIGCEAFRIGFKAFWNVLVIVPAAAAALFPGPTRRFAKKAATRMLLHGAEMIAATAGLGVLVILMAEAARGTMAGTNPFPKVLLMVLIAVFGAFGFRFMLRAFGDAGIPGPIRMTRWALSGSSRATGAIDGIGNTGRKINGLRSRLADRNGKQSGQGQAEGGSAGQKAPGRKPHPPTSSRPPSGPSGNAPSRPSPGPGRGPGGAGGATFAGNGTGSTRTPAVARPGNGAGRPGAAGGGATRAATAGAARGATAVVAPEVAAAVAAGGAAKRAASQLHNRGHGVQQDAGNAPGRRPSRADDIAAHDMNAAPTTKEADQAWQQKVRASMPPPQDQAPPRATRPPQQ